MFRARLLPGDGSTVQAQNLMHVTLIPDGTVTVAIDDFNLQCS